MKFVADVNVPKPLITALRADGHEVIWITDIDRRLKDQPILDLALREDALILTNDSDFEKHVLVEKHPTHGVVWMRVGWMPRKDRTERVREGIRVNVGQLLHHFTTIYPDRVEQRPLPPPPRP